MISSLLEMKVGEVVDMPLEEFKKRVEDEKLNLGNTNNLRSYLIGMYSELSARKDLLIKKDFSREDISKAIEGVYVEMLRLEEKIVYLDCRKKMLLKDGKIDSKKVM